MDNITLINYMKSEYHRNKGKFDKMRRYYDGQHDIFKTYKKRKNSMDRATATNWVSKFISEEIAYALNKPVSYISLPGDKAAIDAIYKAYEHFDLNCC